MAARESGNGAAIVEVSELTVRYGSRTALDRVALTFREGISGLLGPNGAGKSTLLKTLLGFCRPSGGWARLLGQPAGARSLRRFVGYMPERDVTSPKLSAVSFVAYCGCLAGMPYRDALQRTHEVLNYVGFGEERYRMMETYSTGMRQRAKLAQALVHDPRLLFLDEPTNGLDPLGRVAMLDLIRDIARQRGVAIILSSHLLPDVEHVCERVVLLDRGKVVEQGTLADLTGLQEHRVSVRIKEGADRLARRLAALGQGVERQEDGSLIIESATAEDRKRLFRAAAEEGLQIRQFTPVRHRLEEIFYHGVSADS
ncbi:MAG: ABC transporter ATP-binding protein [Candidatus Hydrogenedentes bacterium]|nr:ABC transporter ATP-binding protein [Candidatus Hydrogenedentota bacterium]